MCMGARTPSHICRSNVWASGKIVRQNCLIGLYLLDLTALVHQSPIKSTWKSRCTNEHGRNHDRCTFAVISTHRPYPPDTLAIPTEGAQAKGPMNQYWFILPHNLWRWSARTMYKPITRSIWLGGKIRSEPAIHEQNRVYTCGFSTRRPSCPVS